MVGCRGCEPPEFFINWSVTLQLVHTILILWVKGEAMPSVKIDSRQFINRSLHKNDD